MLEREGQRSSLTTQLRSEQESQQAVLHEKLQQLNGLQLQLEQVGSTPTDRLTDGLTDGLTAGLTDGLMD